MLRQTQETEFTVCLHAFHAICKQWFQEACSAKEKWQSGGGLKMWHSVGGLVKEVLGSRSELCSSLCIQEGVH